MTTEITYGIGGHNPLMLNNNIIDVTQLPELEQSLENTTLKSAIQKLVELGLTDEEVKSLKNDL